MPVPASQWWAEFHGKGPWAADQDLWTSRGPRGSWRLPEVSPSPKERFRKPRDYKGRHARPPSSGDSGGPPSSRRLVPWYIHSCRRLQELPSGAAGTGLETSPASQGSEARAEGMSWKTSPEEVWTNLWRPTASSLPSGRSPTHSVCDTPGAARDSWAWHTQEQVLSLHDGP